MAQNPHPAGPDLSEGARLFAANCPTCHGAEGKGGRGPSLVAGAWKHGGTAVEIARNIHDGIPGTAMPAFPLPEGETEAIAQWLLSLNTQPTATKVVELTIGGGKHLSGVVIGEDTFSLYLRSPDGTIHMLRKEDMTEAAPGLGVTWDRLKNSAAEPQNWLQYWGDLQGTHFSGLKAITPADASGLAAQWTFQYGGSSVEATPIVADGMMFVTGPRDDASALDARTGFRLWHYRRTLPAFHANCTVSTNRGVAILGDRLFMGTLDAHLVALEAKTGHVAWDVEVDDYKKGFSITHAPLMVGDKIIVGVTAGECALYGFIDAYDAATGRRLWRVHAIAQPGDPARASWAGKSAETGGGPTWMTGTYDPETDTIFWATGNPSPDYDGSVRAGDDLYTCSVLALDPKTGRMKWYFQFTPHDTHDWDATETPVLIDAVFEGRPRKLMIHADRNAFFYVLDRETGKFLLGKPFVRQTWAKGLDANGRPIVVPNTDPTPAGNYVCPDALGGTNWNSPSWDPGTRLFYVAATESCATYKSVVKEPVPGLPFTGTGDQKDESVGGKGVVTAIDPFTGNVRWKYPLQLGSQSAGVLGTAGGVLFAASKDGYLLGLDSRSGKLLWRYQTGAEIRSSPISYAVGGRQYIAVSNDSALTVFALPELPPAARLRRTRDR